MEGEESHAIGTSDYFAPLTELIALFFVVVYKHWAPSGAFKPHSITHIKRGRRFLVTDFDEMSLEIGR